MNNSTQQQQQQLNSTACWAQLALCDAPETPIVQVRILSAMRCPMCGAVLVHVIGRGCECPRCGAVVDL